MTPVGDTLVLVLQHGRAVEVEELGQLFSGLARDYRQFTGDRTLIIERLATGSLIVYLRDAAEAVRPYLTGVEEWAKAGKALLDFATALKNIILRAKKDPEESRLFSKGRKRIGARSVESLLKIATDSGSEVLLKHVASDGETLEIQVNPIEAVQIREAAEARRLAHLKDPPSLVTGGQPQLVIPDFKSGSLARALAGYSGSDDVIPPDVRTIIRSMVRMLKKNGVSFMIEAVASDVQAEGRNNLAYAIREEAARL